MMKVNQRRGSRPRFDAVSVQGRGTADCIRTQLLWLLVVCVSMCANKGNVCKSFRKEKVSIITMLALSLTETKTS